MSKTSPFIQIKTKKDKIHINDLETKSGVLKLKSDGFTRKDIMSAMYDKTYGSNTIERTKMMGDFFNKGKK